MEQRANQARDDDVSESGYSSTMSDISEHSRSGYMLDLSAERIPGPSTGRRKKQYANFELPPAQE
eukprot:CAMPEP_0168532832 /NCGR_PEP_ID=MMETSP0405-20121227/16596_1 /TAXON_ID=498012 /ORGANISM="Trichosphaerium sp, Strain Am-I-7 wt" /LENGTH=64 /DNA_ID=CAMNT_0008558537 /DNA_START=12 /DNA_END=203 /DNA_ORIENTATION=+